MEDKKLQGKVIVISGGTKGVGKAAAEEFAKEGAKVVIGGRDEVSAQKSIRLMKPTAAMVFLFTVIFLESKTARICSTRRMRNTAELTDFSIMRVLRP